jgi:hypothetical protein
MNVTVIIQRHYPASMQLIMLPSGELEVFKSHSPLESLYSASNNWIISSQCVPRICYVYFSSNMYNTGL